MKRSNIGLLKRLTFVDHVHVTDKVSFFQSFGVIGMTQQILPFKLGTILQTGKERNLFSTQ